MADGHRNLLAISRSPRQRAKRRPSHVAAVAAVSDHCFCGGAGTDSALSCEVSVTALLTGTVAPGPSANPGFQCEKLCPPRPPARISSKRFPADPDVSSPARARSALVDTRAARSVFPLHNYLAAHALHDGWRELLSGSCLNLVRRAHAPGAAFGQFIGPVCWIPSGLAYLEACTPKRFARDDTALCLGLVSCVRPGPLQRRLSVNHPALGPSDS
jgi:hypothetical protein